MDKGPSDVPDVSVELEHSIGFAGAVYDGQHYHPNGRDYVYAAGACVGTDGNVSTLVMLSILHGAVICDFTDPHKQHFLRGHNGNVTCLALSPSVMTDQPVRTNGCITSFPSCARAGWLHLGKMARTRMLWCGTSRPTKCFTGTQSFGILLDVTSRGVELPGSRSTTSGWPALRFQMTRFEMSRCPVPCREFTGFPTQQLLVTCGAAADRNMIVWDLSTYVSP